MSIDFMNGSERVFGSPIARLNQEPILLNNFISLAWRRNTLPALRSNRPIFYSIGMINFALSLPVRIAIAAAAAIRVLVLFVKAVYQEQFGDIGRTLKESGLVFLGSLGELVSCAIGVVCPPIAYKIDEFIQHNQIINKWYHDHYLSVWSDRVNELPVARRSAPQRNRNSRLDNIVEQIMDHLNEIPDAFNQRRMDAKERRAASHLHYFKDGKIALEKWVSADHIDARMPLILNRIAILGILGAIEKKDSLDIFIEEVNDVTLKSGLKDKLEEITSSIDKCMQKHALARDEIVQSVVHFVILDCEDENATEYFLGGITTKKELKKLLVPLEKSELEEIAALLHRFTDELFATDRTMYAVIGQAAYK